jgi:hypothetical protein
MRTRILGWLAIACATVAFPAAAHHSFAVWDMTKSIEFDGVVETVKLRNPHMAMTLIQTKPDGTKETINFTEGAPANMIVRMGLKPEDIAPGKHIKAIGAPRKDNSTEYFLKAIILPDGTKITAVP